MLRPLAFVTFGLAALYGGYWVVGSRAALSGAEAALAALKSEGRADYSGVELHGFPSRFDVTISDPRLLDPASGATIWSAPFLQVLALSYRPNQVIAVWPHEQSLTLGPAELGLTSEDLRASVALGASLSLPLDHAEVEGHGLTLSAGPELSVHADKLIFATRPSEGPASHQAALVLTGLAPAPALRSRIDPASRLPAVLEELRADATLTFDRPLDRSLTTATPRLTAIRAIDAKGGWGRISLTAQGELAVDANGFAEGRIKISATHWRDLLDLAREAGALSPDMARSLTNGLQAVALASGDPERLELPLIFRDGESFLGPFALGAAPRF